MCLIYTWVGILCAASISIHERILEEYVSSNQTFVNIFTTRRKTFSYLHSSKKRLCEITYFYPAPLCVRQPQTHFGHTAKNKQKSLLTRTIYSSK